MKFIIPMIVGGLIGYFTNWLAIKMLFRPYEEKYLLGFKVPFTPGLIPKEQKRIAKNIGITVEEYLLSPEAIIDNFEADRIEKSIKEEINNKIEKIKKEEVMIKDILSSLSNEQIESLEIFFDDLPDKIIEIILLEENQEYFKKFIYNIISDDDNIDNFRSNLLELLSKIKESDIIDRNMDQFIREILDKNNKDERLLSEVLSEETEKEICSYLDENQRIIGYRIREIITSKEVKEKLKYSISNLVEENVSSLITSFIPMDSLTENIYKALENYIKSDRAIEDINDLLKTLVDKALDLKIREVSEMLFENVDIDSFIIKANKMIKNNINIEKISNIIMLEYYRLDKKLISSKISSIIRDKISSKKFKSFLNSEINKLIVRFENIYIMDVIDILKIDAENFYSWLNNIFDRKISDNLPEIISSLGIASIVENTINEFDFDFVEKLILDIADKELKAITNLGGVLGATIGLITPFLQML